MPDLGDELLIVIDRLEALLGSMAIWEMRTTSGYQPRSPTARRWAPSRPCETWCGQPKDATNRGKKRGDSSSGPGDAEGIAARQDRSVNVRASPAYETGSGLIYDGVGNRIGRTRPT